MPTLTYGVTALTLPDDLLWDDEHTWVKVEQSTEYTITGALIVEAAAKQAGRSITLVAGENFGWITRAALTTLLAWAALPAQTFTLNLRGTNRTVVFDQANAPIVARPLVDYATPDDADVYVITLRFIEV